MLLDYSKWFKTNFESKLKLANELGFHRSGSVHTVSGPNGAVVKEDGFTMSDLENITVEKLQKFVDSIDNDINVLFDLAIMKVEGKLIQKQNVQEQKQAQNEETQKIKEELRLLELERQKEEEKRKKRIKEVILPMLSKEVGSVFDAIITIQTMGHKLQEVSSAKAIELKLADCKDGFKLNMSAEHSKRYELLLEEFKDDKLKDVFTVLNGTINEINFRLTKENQDRKLEDLINDKPANKTTE